MAEGVEQPAVVVQAHAKVNLALQVRGRRPDGYHEVRMVMTPLALHDLVQVQVTEGELSVVADDPLVPSGPENLVYRAVQALRRQAGCRSGAAVTLHKRIPAAAGLGGGSADAAAALLALNQLWGLQWPLERLQELAAPLGADIPFCLLGRTALAEGIGERLTPLPPVLPWPVVVATPTVVWPGPKTATVYRAYRPGPEGSVADVGRVLHALQSQDGQALARALANDLEAGAVALQPVIGKLKDRMLGAGAWGAVMAGAGPTVLAICPDTPTAARVAQAAQDLAGRVVVTELLGAAPLPLS